MEHEQFHLPFFLESIIEFTQEPLEIKNLQQYRFLREHKLDQLIQLKGLRLGRKEFQVGDEVQESQRSVKM